MYLVSAIKCFRGERSLVHEEHVEGLISSNEGVVDCDIYREASMKRLNLTDTVMKELDNAMKECKKNGLDGCLTLSGGPHFKQTRCTCDVLYIQYVKPLKMKKGECKKMTKDKREKLHADFNKHEHWSKMWEVTQAERTQMLKMMASMGNNKTQPPNKENVDKNNEYNLCLCSKDTCNKSSGLHAIGNAFLCLMTIVTLIVSIF